MSRIQTTNMEKARMTGIHAHNQRVKTDREYRMRWLIRNAAPRTSQSVERGEITLPRVAFLERPELFPEI